MSSFGWYFAASMFVILVVGIAICVLSDRIELWRAERKDLRSMQRGFEVKLNAGGEPVAKEKENDHG